MKTEQEIKQMVNTCNQYHNCALCPYNPEDISRFIGDRWWKGGCPNYDRKLVYAMGKGYGEVSEYKAEIERLNSYNGFLQLEISHSKDMLDESVKQAQIDVLYKLKKNMHTEDFDTPDERWKPESEFCAIIDELIKEIEDGKEN